MNNNLLGQLKLSQLLFYTNAQPFRIDVHLELRCLKMLRHLNLKKGVIGIIEFSQTKFILSFIALAYFSLFRIHSDWLLRFKFFWISFSFFSIFLFCHFLVHLSSRLLCIWCFLLSLLLFRHIFFHFFSFFLIILLLPFLEFSLFDRLKKGGLKSRKNLLSFDPLGRSNYFPVIALKCENMSNDVILATRPIFTRISCDI